MNHKEFKNNQSEKFKNDAMLRKDKKLETELGADYFDLTPSDINTNGLKTKELVELSERSLKEKYQKKTKK